MAKQDDKNKNKKKRSVSDKKMPEWGKPYKREKLPDGGYKYYYKRGVPGSPGDVDEKPPKMGNEEWKEFLKNETPEEKKRRIERQRKPKPGAKEEKTEVTRPMDPVKGRNVDVPTSKPKRSVGGKIPGGGKPSVAMYSKEKKSYSPDWTPQGKGTKAKVMGTLAAISPVHKRRKGPGGLVQTGRLKKMSTTRPVSEKEATIQRKGKNYGDLKKGYDRTMLGGGTGSGATKKTKSETATEGKMATKKELKYGKKRLSDKKKKKQKDYENSSYRK